MKTEEILNKNPWNNIKLDKLYSSNDTEFVVDDDRDVVLDFNNKIGDDTLNKLILNIPPEPWQGNPLKAKVIFLSLNPGYIERANKKLAMVFQNYKEILGPILDFKMKTLKLESDSFFPLNNDEKPIGCKDAISMLGDWYWEDAFQPLIQEACVNGFTENDFYKNVAIIQHFAYSSIKCQRVFPPKRKPLSSQNFTKELIQYIIDNNPNTLFVIMRSISKWKEFLGEDLFNECDNDNQRRFLLKENKGMSQAFSRNNLGDDKFERILKALKQ